MIKPVSGGVNLHCDTCDRPSQNLAGATALYDDANDAVDTGHDDFWYTDPATGYALCGSADDAHLDAAAKVRADNTDAELLYRLYSAYPHLLAAEVN